MPDSVASLYLIVWMCNACLGRCGSPVPSVEAPLVSGFYWVRAGLGSARWWSALASWSGSPQLSGARWSLQCSVSDRRGICQPALRPPISPVSLLSSLSVESSRYWLIATEAFTTVASFWFLCRASSSQGTLPPRASFYLVYIAPVKIYFYYRGRF